MPINITITDRDNSFPEIKIEIITKSRAIYQADTFTNFKNILDKISLYYPKHILQYIMVQIDYVPLFSTLSILELEDLQRYVQKARNYHTDHYTADFYEGFAFDSYDARQNRLERVVCDIENFKNKKTVEKLVGIVRDDIQHVREPVVSMVPTHKPC